MKNLLFAFLLFGTVNVFAQDSKYESAMKTNLAKMDSAKTTADFQSVSAAFERIGDAEKTQWLPYYYAGLALTLPAWTDENLDKDANADKIKAFADKADALATGNDEKAEIEALRNMASTQQMMIDPQTRWQTDGTDANNALQKGMQLDPNNPRLYYLQAMSVYGTPEQFGGGKDKAKPIFDKALTLFKAEKTKPLYPGWGQQQTEEVLAQYK